MSNFQSPDSVYSSGTLESGESADTLDERYVHIPAKPVLTLSMPVDSAMARKRRTDTLKKPSPIMLNLRRSKRIATNFKSVAGLNVAAPVHVASKPIADFPTGSVSEVSVTAIPITTVNSTSIGSPVCPKQDTHIATTESSTPDQLQPPHPSSSHEQLSILTTTQKMAAAPDPRPDIIMRSELAVSHPDLEDGQAIKQLQGAIWTELFNGLVEYFHQLNGYRKEKPPWSDAVNAICRAMHRWKQYELRKTLSSPEVPQQLSLMSPQQSPGSFSRKNCAEQVEEKDSAKQTCQKAVRAYFTLKIQKEVVTAQITPQSHRLTPQYPSPKCRRGRPRKN